MSRPPDGSEHKFLFERLHDTSRVGNTPLHPTLPFIFLDHVTGCAARIVGLDRLLARCTLFVLEK